MATRTARRLDLNPYATTDVNVQLQRDQVRWWVVYGAMMCFVLVVAVMANRTAPAAFAIAFTVLVLSCVACFVRPTVGVYVIVFLTLVGDQATTPWWPFAKNLSSEESIFFVGDSLSINPLEILLVVTTVSWLLQRLVDPRWSFKRGRLLVPLVIFTLILFVGFMYGAGTGGDRRVAIFEFRPFIYLLVVYILVTNLLTTRMQYRRLFMLAMVAITIQSLFALSFYRGLTEAERDELESLAEFTSTIHMATLVLFFLAVLLLRCRAEWRWALFAMSVPVTVAFFISQRRSAMVSLFVGFFMLAVVLYRRRRRMFYFFVPATAVLGSGFVAATWNAEGPLGLAATATKSVLFPGQLSAKDQSSDLYRRIEAYNIWFTIRAKPVTGVGFGNPFFRPAPLPDITFFEFWEYLPHNAVLWIAIKAGVFALVALFFLFGRAIQWGTRAAVTVKRDEDAALAYAATAYLAMYLAFAYVNIAWDTRSTVFMAVCLAICGELVKHTTTKAPPVRRSEPAVRPVAVGSP